MKNNRNIMVLMSGISGMIINILYIFLCRTYDYWTKEQLSIMSSLLIFVIIIVYFVSKKDIKERSIQYLIILFIVGIGICSKVDKEFIEVFLLNSFISMCIIIINKKRNVLNIILSISILAIGMATSCMILNEKSMQDYKSFYEIQRIVSNDKKCEAVVSMYDRDSEGYVVMVTITNRRKSKNIYLAKQKDLEVNVKWLSENKIVVNNQEINIKNEIYDKRGCPVESAWY